MKRRDKANYMIQSVSHAFDVLEELARAKGEVGVTELSKRLKLHKNNVFRLLATLQLRGYVDQNLETEDYRLGSKVLEIGQCYLTQSTLIERAAPIIKRFADEIGETVNFAILQNGFVQYPVTIESKKPVRVSSRAGHSYPIKVNATGRLLTAHLPDAILEEMLAGNTPQDAAVKNQLNELRASGQIIDRAATEADVTTISCIVRANGNIVAGAVEVQIPQYRSEVDSTLPKTQEIARELSTALGMSDVSIHSQIEKEILSSSIRSIESGASTVSATAA